MGAPSNLRLCRREDAGVEQDGRLSTPANSPKSTHMWDSPPRKSAGCSQETPGFRPRKTDFTESGRTQERREKRREKEKQSRSGPVATGGSWKMERTQTLGRPAPPKGGGSRRGKRPSTSAQPLPCTSHRKLEWPGLGTETAALAMRVRRQAGAGCPGERGRGAGREPGGTVIWSEHI